MGKHLAIGRHGVRPVGQLSNRARRREPGIVDIERLEDRQLLSYTSTILSDLYSHSGNAWTYQDVNSAGTTTASETFLAKGNTTFDGHDVYQLQTNLGTTSGTLSESTTLNDYFATTSDGIVDYGTSQSTTLASSATTTTTSSQTTFNPDKVLLPASLTPGTPTPVTESWTRTIVTTGSTGVTTTSMVSDSYTFTLVSDSTQSVTVPAGTYNAYEVDITEMTYSGESPTTSQEEVFVAQGTGLVKDVDGPLATPNDTVELTQFTPNGSSTTGTTTSTSSTTTASVLTPTLSGTLPTSVIAGAPAKINQAVTITNTGGAAYDATATSELFLSTGTTITSSSIQLPQTITKTLKLKPGAHAAEKFTLKSLPSTVPDGTYYVVAEVIDSNGNAATTPSSGTITVAPPEVTLSASFSKFASTAVAGKKLKEKIIVSNTAGNEAAAGTLPIVVETSPDGLTTDATVVTTILKKINLKQGKSISIPLTLATSAAMNDDYLIVQLDPTNALHSVSTAGETITSPVTLTIS
ncbi:MAG TPA: hypothetical protein VHY37_10190 [Tepidisphaeraceae bacterium]|nr:hypothetical protein [Tepidisphaeraceae bacterium]